MNDDLISRQAALRQKFTAYYTNGAEIKQIEAVPVREIEKLQAVDAVPVRCKNCRYNSNPPERGNAACVLFYGMTDQMGFCHHGERREQDETD